jgi:hypothetical protein
MLQHVRISTNEELHKMAQSTDLRGAIQQTSFKAARERDFVYKWYKNVHASLQHAKIFPQFL